MRRHFTSPVDGCVVATPLLLSSPLTTRHGSQTDLYLVMSLSQLNLATGCLLASTIVFAFVSCYQTDLQNRILGGTETTIEDFPFQLALEGGGRQLCGGSILSRDWALTAAHCVHDQPARWLVFRAGSSMLLSGGSLHPVDYYKTHERYAKTFTYDVAIVKVRVPFAFSNQVRPVSLPSRVPENGELTWVSGWGHMQKERVKKPKQLMMIDIYIIKWDECKKLYKDYFSESMLCAGFYEKDTCSGDSGGPLVRSGSEQVGIVSWGYQCGDGLPSVFTNLSVVTPWILKNTRLIDDDEPFVFPSY